MRDLRVPLVLAAVVALSAWFAQAQNSTPAESPFASQTIDLGTVVSDVEKSVAWYKNVVGFQERDGFDIPPDFARQTGLTNQLPFHVHVLTLGADENATKLKLMQFKTSPGARTDQNYIHSTYGFRYLTIFVADLNAAVARAATHGVKPIAEGPVGLPAGFPEGLGLAVLRDPDGNFVELVGPLKK
jgi:catechol 2,3-dioxygenase-like lactoylglutathione lyase family enzyme